MEPIAFEEPKSPDALWQEMVDGLTAEGHLTTRRICDAFRAWGRHLFVDPSDITFQRMAAGDNRSFGIGFRQTISQPRMVAEMTELLAPQLGETALDVGMGSGWQTALLQNLVGKEGNVYAIERIAGLVELARERFERLAISDIHIIHGDGMNPDDVPRGPFDMITCAAGSPDAPDFWKQRLSEKGGRMVYPKEVAAIKEGQTHWSDGHTEQAPEGWDDGPIHALCKTIRTGPDTFLEEFAAGHCRYVPLLPQTE